MRLPFIRTLTTAGSPFALRTNRVFYVVFLPLGLTVAVVAVISLRWRAVHDLPIMMYLGFLMEHYGLVPYRDFFDFNLPGMHMLSMGIGKTIGYGDVGLRLFDLGYLCIILIVTWRCLRPIGWKVAWAGTILFGAAYLWYGPYQSLQREYVLILPLALAILIAFSSPSRRWWIKPALVGFFFGLAATIKLHAVIGLPLLLWFLIRENGEHQAERKPGAVRVTVMTAAACVLPLALMLVYLWSTGALGPFWNIITDYWPLYTRLTVSHHAVSGWNRVWYLSDRYATLGGHGLWMMPAAMGVFVALFGPSLATAMKRRVIALGGMAMVYGLYPVFAGQFWSYHWLLFHYFILQASALCLVESSGSFPKAARRFPVAALVFVVMLRIAAPHELVMQGEFVREELKGGQVDQIAAFLDEHLQPGDTVQPLDWTDGAVHAMLIARARIATRFVYAFSFYHHISHPYIKSLRREFLAELDRVRPRFVIQMLGSFPWVQGFDTTEDFAELDAFLQQRYRAARQTGEFIIYERLRQP